LKTGAAVAKGCCVHARVADDEEEAAKGRRAEGRQRGRSRIRQREGLPGRGVICQWRAGDLE
jgi:hypothetical protein